MEKDLNVIEKIIESPEKADLSKIPDLIRLFFKNNITKSKVDSYVGDYPTFIEPVYLEKKVKIGDDVLLGPNVYVGSGSEIADYVEISNTIIFKKVRIGKNFKLNNCIVGKESVFNFSNLNVRNCILKDSANSEEELKKIDFLI